MVFSLIVVPDFLNNKIQESDHGNNRSNIVRFIVLVEDAFQFSFIEI